MALSTVNVVLTDLVLLFALAGIVAAFAASAARVPYTIALLVVGLVVSLFGVEFRSDLTPELFSELILSVLVPALLFQGATRIDADQVFEELVPILVLAVVGLPLSVLLLGLAGAAAFDVPLVLALLFGTIVLPTDPVAVLPLFEELGAPERLSVLVDGESMLNDGVAVVLYTTLLDVAISTSGVGATGRTVGPLAQFVLGLGIDVAAAIVGGVTVGGAAGYLFYRFVTAVSDEMTMVLLSVVLVYGAFLLGEALGFSGVVAVVSAGLFIAERRENPTLSADTRLTFRITWRSVAFIGNTLLFLTIGLVTPFDELVRFALPIGVAILLVFLARAVVVYPLATAVDRGGGGAVPRPYQHVLVWSGIHVSIPLALVLGLPAGVPDAVAEQFRSLVFGIATFTLVVQGLTMESLVHRLGIATR